MRINLSILVLFTFSVGGGILLGYVYFYANLFASKVTTWKKYFQVPHGKLYENYLLKNNIRQTTLNRSDDTNYIVVNEGKHMMRKTNILCFVMLKKDETVLRRPHMPTMVKSWDAIRHTWGNHCARLLFFTNEIIDDRSLEIYSLQSYGTNSWSGTQLALLKISELGLLEEYNWYLKVEEDTFVIVENLAYYLSIFDHRVSYYFGHPYSLWSSTYNSGGAGYVLSQTALRKVLAMISKGHCERSYTAEDINLGRYMVTSVFYKIKFEKPCNCSYCIWKVFTLTVG